MRIIARVDGCNGQAIQQVQEETAIPIARLIGNAGAQQSSYNDQPAGLFEKIIF